MKKRAWIISASPERLAQAKVLIGSLRRFSSAPIQLINPYSTSVSGKKKGVAELVGLSRLRGALTALKEGADEAIVLGADNFFYSDPMEIGHTYAGREALFIPHCQNWLKPPHDQNRNLIRAGVINSDLHVWRNTPAVRDFMRIIIQEIDHGPLYNAFELEQWWLPYCLSHLDAELIKHPGYGVAYYNMHEREILGSTSSPVVRRTNGVVGELRNMHYSGMTFAEGSNLLTQYNHPFERVLTKTETELFEDYRQKVSAEMALDGAAAVPQN